MNVETLTIPELLRAHGSIMDELRRRDIVRSANNPISGLAEVLFRRAFNWQTEGNSASGHDAKDGAGHRYQITAGALPRPRAHVS